MYRTVIYKDGMDDKETSNRRVRLRELIQTAFNGSLEELLRFIELRTGKRPNQGEMSALQKPEGKSFGDKKAKVLTEQIGLHRRWFDAQPGTNLGRDQWLADPNAFSTDDSFFNAYNLLKPANKRAAQQVIVGLLASQKMESPKIKGLLADEDEEQKTGLL